VKGLALVWPFLIECLAFFSNFVGVFGLEGLAFSEKINLATLRQRIVWYWTTGSGSC